MKIGQEIKLVKDMPLINILSEITVIAKEGDKGFIDSRGMLHITTGAAKGRIITEFAKEVKGHDVENIAKMVQQRIMQVIRNEGVDELMDKEDLDSMEESVIYNVMDILEKILR